MAILWHEQWHEALEEASRLYFGDSNVAGMLAVLSPLHRQLRKPEGAQTLKEHAFEQAGPLGVWCLSRQAQGSGS